ASRPPGRGAAPAGPPNPAPMASAAPRPAPPAPAPVATSTTPTPTVRPAPSPPPAEPSPPVGTPPQGVPSDALRGWADVIAALEEARELSLASVYQGAKVLSWTATGIAIGFPQGTMVGELATEPANVKAL